MQCAAGLAAHFAGQGRGGREVRSCGPFRITRPLRAQCGSSVALYPSPAPKGSAFEAQYPQAGQPPMPILREQGRQADGRSYRTAYQGRQKHLGKPGLRLHHVQL